MPSFSQGNVSVLLFEQEGFAMPRANYGVAARDSKQANLNIRHHIQGFQADLKLIFNSSKKVQFHPCCREMKWYLFHGRNTQY